jgi:hypothetical protein
VPASAFDLNPIHAAKKVAKAVTHPAHTVKSAAKSVKKAVTKTIPNEDSYCGVVCFFNNIATYC